MTLPETARWGGRPGGRDQGLTMGDDMTRHLTKLHTGPCEVNHWADKIEGAGYTVEARGTESVYVWLPDDPDGWGIIPAMGDLERAIGLSPHYIIRAVVMRSETV